MTTRQASEIYFDQNGFLTRIEDQLFHIKQQVRSQQNRWEPEQPDEHANLFQLFQSSTQNYSLLKAEAKLLLVKRLSLGSIYFYFGDQGYAVQLDGNGDPDLTIPPDLTNPNF